MQEENKSLTDPAKSKKNFRIQVLAVHCLTKILAYVLFLWTRTLFWSPLTLTVVLPILLLDFVIVFVWTGPALTKRAVNLGYMIRHIKDGFSWSKVNVPGVDTIDEHIFLISQGIFTAVFFFHFLGALLNFYIFELILMLIGFVLQVANLILFAKARVEHEAKNLGLDPNAVMGKLAEGVTTMMKKTYDYNDEFWRARWGDAMADWRNK